MEQPFLATLRAPDEHAHIKTNHDRSVTFFNRCHVPRRNSNNFPSIPRHRPLVIKVHIPMILQSSRRKRRNTRIINPNEHAKRDERSLLRRAINRIAPLNHPIKMPRTVSQSVPEQNPARYAAYPYAIL